MKPKWVRGVVILGAVAAVAAATALWRRPEPPSAESLEGAQAAARAPRLDPDYRDVVIPPNIAPLNFRIEEPGQSFVVRVRARQGTPLEIASRSGVIEIPAAGWRRLLTENRRERLWFDVYVCDSDGVWRRYESVTNEIAAEDIDGHIAYRTLKPEALGYRNIGLYQRDLETYATWGVLDGRRFGGGCVNCHAFQNGDPSHWSLHVRSHKYGEAALFVQGEQVHTLADRLGYAAWHPSGKVVVFSRFSIQLFYHSSRGHTRDATDSESLLTCYHLDRKTLRTPPPLADEAQLQTHPTWSPDGRYLYFAGAPKLWPDKRGFLADHYAQVRYDLKRVRYDVESDQWGPVETVLSAERTGKSNVSPRISPDGRLLLFCMCNYGNFPLYQPDSDLYLLNLESGEYRKLECNSEFAESWHCWSSNGRWIIFSSKRPTGIFTRLYLCHLDKDGLASKPFLLPQRDPGYYDDLLSVYNLPEFMTGPIKTSCSALLQAVRDTARVQAEGTTGTRSKPRSPESGRLRPE